MKLEFKNYITSCKGGELLGIIHNNKNTTKLVILKEDGDIEEVDIDYVHKCKIVNEETSQEKKHR